MKVNSKLILHWKLWPIRRSIDTCLMWWQSDLGKKYDDICLQIPCDLCGKYLYLRLFELVNKQTNHIIFVILTQRRCSAVRWTSCAQRRSLTCRSSFKCAWEKWKNEVRAFCVVAERCTQAARDNAQQQCLNFASLGLTLCLSAFMRVTSLEPSHICQKSFTIENGRGREKLLENMRSGCSTLVASYRVRVEQNLPSLDLCFA